MAKWLLMILNKGVAENGKKMLSENALERIFQPELAIDDYRNKLFNNRPSLNKRSSYSLGYWNGYKRGIEFSQHNGLLPGFHSTHTLIRSMKSGFFWFSNHGKQSLERTVIENVINDYLMGHEQSISLEEACSLESRSGERIEDSENFLFPLPSYQYKLSSKNITISKYVGTYENWAFGTIRIKKPDGAVFSLLLEYGNLGRYGLIKTSDEIFTGIAMPGPGYFFSGQQFQFSNEINGKMMKLEAKSFERTKPPIFERNIGSEPPINYEKCID